MIRVRTLWRSALWLLLAATLAGRVAAMPGWMPVAGPQGITVALCNGGTMTMPMTGKLSLPGKHQVNDCPFAAAAQAGGALGNGPASLGAPILAPTMPAQGTPPSIVAGRALSLPPSTGPPALD